MIPCELNPAATKRFRTSAVSPRQKFTSGVKDSGARRKRELRLFERRDPPRRVRSRRREVLPVGAELPERPLVGDRYGRARASVRFERADHQPAGVMPRVEGSVESAHERQQVVRALDRLGRDVYVLGRVERHRYADGGGEVTRPQTTGEDDRLGLHVASIGADARHRPAIEEQLLDPDALADRGAAVMRALGEGERRVPDSRSRRRAGGGRRRDRRSRSAATPRAPQGVPGVGTRSR